MLVRKRKPQRRWPAEIDRRDGGQRQPASCPMIDLVKHPDLLCVRQRGVMGEVVCEGDRPALKGDGATREPHAAYLQRGKINVGAIRAAGATTWRGGP